MTDGLRQLLFGFLNGDAYILTGSIALSWVVLSRGLAWEKGTRLRNLAQTLTLFYALWLGFMGPIVALGHYNSVLWITIHAAVSLSYVYFCADFRKEARVIMWCSLYAGICCLSTIGGQVQYLVAYFLNDTALSYTVGKLSYLLMIPLALYLRRFNFGKFSSVPKISYWLVLAGDFSIFALTWVEMPWMKTDYRIVITLLAGVACVFAILLVSIFAIYTMCRERSEIIALQAEKQRLQSEREMTTLTESTLDDLRCIRHDLKNQYGYIQLLLQSGRMEDAMAYLEQMTAHMPEQLSYVDCGNRTMNTILNMELTKAKRAEVAVRTHLVVPPVLPFSDDDLCAVMANLMDNAIEECSRLKQAGRQEAQTHLDIHPHKSYLFIMCSNDTDRENLQRHKRGLRTTKDDDQLHGYGTRIVAKIAEKYNGWVEYSLADGQFIAKVILDMAGKEMGA